MSTDAELALAAVAADLIESISLARAAEMAAGLPGRERVMGPREREVARHANPDYAKLRGIPPLDPSAEKWCSYCGNSNPVQLVPGPDHEHGFDDWMCRDELDRHCQARHERRWPPMPERAEPVVMKLARQADDAQAARQQARQQQAAVAQAVARQMWHPPGWTSVPGEGSVDEFGQWRPPQPPARPLIPLAPQAHGYEHTLAGGAYKGHLLSGQWRPFYYGGHPGHVPPALYGSEPAQEGPQEMPGTDAPPGPQERPDGRAGRRMGRARRSLRYSGRRSASKPQAHPGIDGSDSFHGGGADTGGPSGGSSET